MTGSSIWYRIAGGATDTPQRALERVLRAGGFETEAYHSAEAFRAASPRARPPCLVLDVHLGGMSGLELQRLIRTGGSTVPIVIMTALMED